MSHSLSPLVARTTKKLKKGETSGEKGRGRVYEKRREKATAATAATAAAAAAVRHFSFPASSPCPL